MPSIDRPYYLKLELTYQEKSEIFPAEEWGNCKEIIHRKQLNLSSQELTDLKMFIDKILKKQEIKRR